MRTDIYQKITDQIVCDLEKGVRPWLKPWNVEHAAGRITRPLLRLPPFESYGLLCASFAPTRSESPCSIKSGTEM
jgi:hypothetical protein